MKIPIIFSISNFGSCTIPASVERLRTEGSETTVKYLVFVIAQVDHEVDPDLGQ